MAVYLVRLLLLALNDGIGGGVLLGRELGNEDAEAGLGGRLEDLPPPSSFLLFGSLPAADFALALLAGFATNTACPAY